MKTALTDIPHAPLIGFHTPLHRLNRLSAELDVDLWIKRDDLGEIGGGGNKLRKLEYLLQAACDRGNDTLITAGSVQSNHCRLTAAVAARAGLACHLVLTLPFSAPPRAYMQSGNRALFDLFGAMSTTLEEGADSAPALDTLAQELRRDGRNPMVIPIGGSTPLGCLGYVRAAQEIAFQLSIMGGGVFDCTVCGSGSGGMQAGLTVGNALSPFTERIVGMSVGRAATGQLRLVSDLARETQELLGITSETPPVDVCDETRGPGYGLMDVAIRNTLTRAARGDGILLDPVYTGKAFAGLLAMIEDGRIHRRSRVLFIHSGGSPALFAYPEFISEGKPDVA